MRAVLPVVLAAAAATAAVLGIKRMAARPEPADASRDAPARASAYSDIPTAFIAFIMFVALFHWLGVGSDAFAGGATPTATYEDTMIANIPEDCLTGLAPF